jgi:hypothetical protein
LKKIKAGTISQEAQGGTKGGFITGIIGTILNVLYFVCGCIGVILLLVFGVAILGAASANQQKGAPAFPVGPGPARRSFQLPLPKLAEYLPNRGR